MTVLWAVIIIGAIGLIGGVLLAVVSELCRSKENNERLAQIREALPGANCGACGYAGCDAYAEAVEKGAAQPGLCAPGGSKTTETLSALLGVEVDVTPKKVFVKCAGCQEKAVQKFHYSGLSSCAAALAVEGGQKLCPGSCLGFGDCVNACPFGALQIKNGLVFVNEAACVGCGKCVAVCPKAVLALRPAEKKHARVICNNTQKGAVAKKGCAVSCIGCGICAKKCENGAITVTNFLASVDPEKCVACGKCAAACPQKVIVLQ